MTLLSILTDRHIVLTLTDVVVWCLPFVLFLLMVATGPIFYARFWHRYFVHVSLFFLAVSIVYYIVLGLQAEALAVFTEYVQFVSLLIPLYFITSGIHIDINYRSRPFVNVLLLAIGSILSNFIGTTGASVLLIRPFISVNYPHVRPYQVIFFIFTISNVGGALTPIGDPPLFIGFLKGVPFFWTLTHNFLPWLFAIAALLTVFYLIDRYFYAKHTDIPPEEDLEYIPAKRIQITGKRNFVWLALVILGVFIDPNVIEQVPYILLHDEKVSFVREIFLLLLAFLAYRFANKAAMVRNEFSFTPIKEVVFIFIGIFSTMIPALIIVYGLANNPEYATFLTPTNLFFLTGTISGFLDNAPTYLCFLSASMSSQGVNVQNTQDVMAFAVGSLSTGTTLSLQAIAISSVFFGALTYVGNAPNFMVYSIAKDVGVEMPSFGKYLIKYSLPILVPLYILVWLLFIR